jgi:translation elongation factor P/translation initiation factor 5A
MRLRITDMNFTTRHDWLFKLIDENGNDFYIMNEAFYKNHNLKSPITKKELDYYDRGQWITASVEQINGKGIVVSV